VSIKVLLFEFLELSSSFIVLSEHFLFELLLLLSLFVFLLKLRFQQTCFLSSKFELTKSCDSDQHSFEELIVKGLELSILRLLDFKFPQHSQKYVLHVINRNDGWNNVGLIRKSSDFSVVHSLDLIFIPKSDSFEFTFTVEIKEHFQLFVVSVKDFLDLWSFEEMLDFLGFFGQMMQLFLVRLKVFVNLGREFLVKFLLFVEIILFSLSCLVSSEFCLFEV